jgi:hypothetical protein
MARARIPGVGSGGVNRLKKALVRPQAKARSAPAKPAIPRGRGGGRKPRGGGV